MQKQLTLISGLDDVLFNKELGKTNPFVTHCCSFKFLFANPVFDNVRLVVSGGDKFWTDLGKCGNLYFSTRKHFCTLKNNWLPQIDFSAYITDCTAVEQFYNSCEN